MYKTFVKKIGVIDTPLDIYPIDIFSLNLYF